MGGVIVQFICQNAGRAAVPQAPEYRGFHKTGFASLGGCAGGSRSGLWGTPTAALPDRWVLHRTLPLASHCPSLGTQPAQSKGQKES